MTFRDALNRFLTPPGQIAGPTAPAAAPAFSLDVPAPRAARSRLLPGDGMDAGFLALGDGNHQVGAQPERQAMVLGGHSVTGAYLLGGHGLPVPAGVPNRLTASPELLFTMHPLQSAPAPLALGPMPAEYAPERS